MIQQKSQGVAKIPHAGITKSLDMCGYTSTQANKHTRTKVQKYQSAKVHKETRV